MDVELIVVMFEISQFSWQQRLTLICYLVVLFNSNCSNLYSKIRNFKMILNRFRVIIGNSTWFPFNFIGKGLLTPSCLQSSNYYSTLKGIFANYGRWLKIRYVKTPN